MVDPFRMAVLALVIGSSLASADESAERHFEERVRPLLVDRCQKCHSGSAAKAGLRLDSAVGLQRGGESGPVLASRAEDSRLLQAVRHENGLEMPPDGKLDEGQIADLVAWVKAGANWPKSDSTMKDAGTGNHDDATSQHWSFRSVALVELPPGDPSWSDHPIDRFIATKWREQNLTPVAAADKRTLLRRVSFDLIGLPPQPEELSTFLSNTSPDAFNLTVSKLLDSPRYGERWGRYWLDVARYADTAGDNADYPIPEARLYRDYVIDSFNSDKPYDQFVREQLAGDILARSGHKDRYAEQVVATTFLALSRRYATAPYEFWHLSLEDSIDTVGQAFLGLTLRCARCHDHKYDPITMRDYYALYGIFDSTQYPWAGGEEFASKTFPRQHFVPLVSEETATPALAKFEVRLKDLQVQIADAERNLAAATKEGGDAIKTLQEQLNRLRSEHRNLARPGLPPELPGAYAVTEGAVKPAVLQLRGEPERKGPEVPRGAIGVLMAGRPLEIPSNESGRRQLADWITRPDHPLTARVMVNRIWHHHFGRGLVATPSNFGVRGARPAHPELLDWLASEFVRSGWSIKAMHRLILSSKTWQLAANSDEANAALDPANQFHWRHDRRRLDAEAIRDSILLTSGRLDLTRPGEHPFPPIKDWGFTQHSQFKAVYPSTHRSVYLMTQRLQRHPFLALFDGPDPNTTTEKRTSATVPLQALYLMNSAEVRTEAEAFAKRLLAATADDAARIQLGHEIAYARPAESAEISQGLHFLHDYRSQLTGLGRDSSASEIECQSWTSYARVLLTANEFFYVD